MRTSPHTLAVPVNADDHQRGDPAAPITLVEYGDYQCPYCAYAAAVVEEVRQEPSGQASSKRVEVRHRAVIDEQGVP
jgi:protein-disulfide isomerase